MAMRSPIPLVAKLIGTLALVNIASVILVLME
jgi:hypothetical protein